jgi:single-stranded-DNA-specific exonuclease
MKISNRLSNINPETFLDDYLAYCGITNPEEFLNPSEFDIEPPENYDNMKEACDMFVYHDDYEHNIGILVDVDMDGFCSSTLLYKFLKDDINIPAERLQLFLHINKTHGLEDKIVFDQIMKSDINLLFIPDAGSADVAEHKLLKEKGIDVIVLDHHNCKVVSKDAIVINNQMSKKVTNKSASGTHVTWQFCRYIEHQMKLQEDMFKYCDLVAFANLADVMAMNGLENRAVNHFGLNNINNNFLKALKVKFVDKKDELIDLTPERVVWDISPKINALIRSENQDGKILIMEAFISEDTDFAQALLVLGQAHRKQQAYTKELTEQLENEVDDSGAVIIHVVEEEVGSFTGLIAMKLSEKFNKPVILLRKVEMKEGEDEKEWKKKPYIGSMRSPFALQDILNQCKFVNWCSGHASASGVSVFPNNVSKVTEYLNNLEMDTEPYTDATYTFDARNVPEELFGIADKYAEVWANKIEKPVFAITDIYINGTDIEKMGNGSTVKFKYMGLTYIMFYQGEQNRQKMHLGEDIDLNVTIIGELGLNEYNGEISNQVVIKQIEAIPKGLKQSESYDNENDSDWEDIF